MHGLAPASRPKRAWHGWLGGRQRSAAVSVDCSHANFCLDERDGRFPRVEESDSALAQPKAPRGSTQDFINQISYRFKETEVR